MNLIILHESDFVDVKTVKLDDYRHRHIRDTLKPSISTELRVGLLNGNTGTGRVLERGDYTLLEVELSAPPPEAPGISLLLALPRPKVLKRIIYSASTMGVKEFHIINSWRVDKSYWDSPALERKVLDDLLIAALEQSKDTIMPDIYFHRFFSKFADNRLPELMDGKTSLLAHPGSGEECIPKSDIPLLLAVGPEGGFIQREVDRFFSMGFSGVSIGERILKVETAVTALIAKLS